MPPHCASGSAARRALDHHVHLSRPLPEDVDAVFGSGREVRQHRTGFEPARDLRNDDAVPFERTEPAPLDAQHVGTRCDAGPLARREVLANPTVVGEVELIAPAEDRDLGRASWLCRRRHPPTMGAAAAGRRAMPPGRWKPRREARLGRSRGSRRRRRVPCAKWPWRTATLRAVQNGIRCWFGVRQGAHAVEIVVRCRAVSARTPISAAHRIRPARATPEMTDAAGPQHP